jgi:hypothetical protein
MQLSRTLPMLFLATALAVFGCKKKEDAAAGAAGSSPAKAAEPAAGGAATTPAATPPTPAAPAGGTTIASDDDYVAKALSSMDKLVEIFKAGGTDCDKIADDITKLTTEDHAQFTALQAYEKSHPGAQKKFDEAAKPKQAAFEASAGPTMNACKNNKKLNDAMAKLAPG